MKFHYSVSKRFHLGIEVFDWYEHVEGGHYDRGLGLCIAFGFRHIDIHFKTTRVEYHED